MKTKKLLIATSNRGKFKEIADILKPYLPIGYKLISAVNLDKTPKVNENEDTYLKNALKKAKAYAKASGLISVSDDSGLEVKCLSKKPGIKSARFAGYPASDKRNIKKLLKLMKKVPPEKRKARFICAAVAYFPETGKHISAKGFVKGYITQMQSGKNGFGYDPVFYYVPFKKTFASVSNKRKNSVSHRSIAFKILAEKLKIKL